MAIIFLLLGAFQIQTAEGRTETITDTMAARILAYLAFRGTFCTRNEIVAACWGPHKLQGRDKLEEEAYQRQVSNLRAIFTRTLGLRWEDHLLVQPNGLQLRTGTYATDLSQFDELATKGMDQRNPDSERLQWLREAERLRRGYLLDGMHCEWIVSQDEGARALYERRYEEIKRTVASLQGPRRTSPMNAYPVVSYEGMDGWLPILSNMIAGTSQEIVLYGINFYITVPMLQTALLDRLRAGVRIKILVLDPNGEWLHHMASAIGNEEATLRSEGLASLSRLSDIRKEWEAECTALSRDADASKRFEVQLFDSIIHGRAYAVDPDTENGKLILIPYIFGVRPAQLPCYLWNYSAQGPYQTYTRELRRLWANASA